jgi:hypothetical protein
MVRNGKEEVPPAGCELSQEKPEKRTPDRRRAARGAALSENFPPGGARQALTDPDLERVVAAWSTLPDATRQAILRLVDEHA